MKKLIPVFLIIFISLLLGALYLTRSNSLSGGFAKIRSLGGLRSSDHSVFRKTSMKESQREWDDRDYKIPLSVEGKFWDGDTVFYNLYDLHGGKFVNALIDEQEADPFNRIIPKTQFKNNWRSQVDYPSVAVIDLGGFYRLSHEYFYSSNNFGTIMLLYGEPFNWSTDTIRLRPATHRWSDMDKVIHTRYLKIQYDNGQTGNQDIREMVLYGRLIKDSLSRTAPRLPKDTFDFTMGTFMGFNQIGPAEVDSVGSVMRHFMQFDWIDTVTTTHNIDQVKFVFSKFGHPSNPPFGKGSPKQYFFPEQAKNSTLTSGFNVGSREAKEMIRLGQVGYFDAIQGTPEYAKKQKSFKPIDKVNHPQQDPADAHQYDRTARMMWNYAAFYGNKRYPANLMQTPYPEISGLGIRAYVEQGNEMNKNWAGREQHFTAQEYTAFASAFYDGHVGTMGPRMGVKPANPDMTVVMAGTAGMPIEYFKGIQYYAYYTRKDHSIPFDIVNFHFYPTSGENGAGTEPHAASPETYWKGGRLQKFITQVKELMPGKPIWITEWGYDRSPGSPLVVKSIPGLSNAVVQAQWIARFWFILSFSGIDRSTVFQLSDGSYPDAKDQPKGYHPETKFATTGLVNGRYVGDQFSPKVYTHEYYAYPAYYFQKAIWERLHDYRPEKKIYEDSDGIWVYKYRNVHHPDSVAYAIWSGTEVNRIVNNYDIEVGSPGTEAIVVKLEDKQFYGTKSSMKISTSGRLSMDITETPLLLFTKDGRELTLVKRK